MARSPCCTRAAARVSVCTCSLLCTEAPPYWPAPCVGTADPQPPSACCPTARHGCRRGCTARRRCAAWVPFGRCAAAAVRAQHTRCRPVLMSHPPPHPPPVAPQVEFVDPKWGPFRQRGLALGTIPISAFDCVSQEAVQAAEALLESMLAVAPQVCVCTGMCGELSTPAPASPGCVDRGAGRGASHMRPCACPGGTCAGEPTETSPTLPTFAAGGACRARHGRSRFCNHWEKAGGAGGARGAGVHSRRCLWWLPQRVFHATPPAVQPVQRYPPLPLPGHHRPAHVPPPARRVVRQRWRGL